MLPFLSLTLISCIFAGARGALAKTSLKKHVDSLTLDFDFDPIKPAYWTGYPHHRRTPFAVSPNGKAAYLAYLDASETDVHVQQVNPSTFKAVGTAKTISGAKEAGGLIAHNDGFAVLTNEPLPSGTSNAPPDNTPVACITRYTNGQKSWKTYLGGPSVVNDYGGGYNASPDMNGDLVYSEEAGLYGAYVVVTAYTGDAAGHFGDSIQYVQTDGTLKQIEGASSTFGCSHNTGIALEAADEAPFASICAEDQGAIWLNTQTQYMDGVKIANENTTNGASGEPMGGMSGSYSALARMRGKDSYIFAWPSRGAIDLAQNEWLGGDYTSCLPRNLNRNVAIARFPSKSEKYGQEASSEVGAASGDDNVHWITYGTADHSNVHVAAFDGRNALVTWEEIADPSCDDFIAMGCTGTFTGSHFQLISGARKSGKPIKSMDVYVAGDMVTMPNGNICWPYVSMDWSLGGAITSASTTSKMSFACMTLN